jgi:anti-sigma-K factor RskA
MNSTPPIDTTPVPDSDDLIAAEYVLGLLEASARRDAQTRLKHDEAFAAQVAAWETYFTPWLEAIAPVEVPAALWTRRSAATRPPRWQSRRCGTGSRCGAASRPVALPSPR